MSDSKSDGLVFSGNANSTCNLRNRQSPVAEWDSNSRFSNSIVRYLNRNTRILIKGSVDQVGRKQTEPAKLGEHRDQNFDSNQIS